MTLASISLCYSLSTNLAPPLINKSSPGGSRETLGEDVKT